MKKLSTKALVTGVAVMFFAFLAMLTPSVASAGGIVSTHGHHGNIEYQDRVDSSKQFLGWGLDFTQASGMFNWIHYDLQTPLFTHTRFLAIQFATGSADMNVNAFEIYDGEQKIFGVNGLNLSGDAHRTNWYIIDMGSDRFINRALGISIEIGAGVEMMSHRMQVFAVAAEWH